MARPASEKRSSGSTERISRHVPVTLTAMTLSNTLASTWPIGAMTPSTRGIGDQDVELSPALVDRAAEPVDAGHVGEVERHQRRLALAGPGALGLDLVVEFFQPADGARHRDHMRAGGRQVLCR